MGYQKNFHVANLRNKIIQSFGATLDATSREMITNLDQLTCMV